MNFRKIIFLIPFLLIIGCDKSKTYEGRLIEMDFQNVEDVSHGLWIKIDDTKFTHVRTMREGDSIHYALPSTFVVVDSTSTRTFGSPLEPRNIGIYLVRYLQYINTEVLPEEEPKYTFGSQGLLSVTGRLQLQKTDSSLIKIETPENYPIPIKVLN